MSRPEPLTHADRPATPSDVPPTSGTFQRHLTLESVPRIALLPQTLRELPLDHRAGFLVWLIDGASTVEAILDACPMDREHAFAMLGVLAAHGVIAFE